MPFLDPPQLRAHPDSLRLHLDMAALDAPPRQAVHRETFWDAGVIEEIRRSGFIDQLYKRQEASENASGIPSPFATHRHRANKPSKSQTRLE